MSTPYFDFRRFRIRHDRCAMKVGTDAVLLGAWADVTKAKNILDIGCGSGLITIMAAQRNPTATLTGIEIETNAAGQAQENSEASPYADRIEIICSDIRHYQPARRFDCILSNPPFFEEKLLPPDKTRSTARHTAGLPFSELLKEAKRLLEPNGLFHVIIPYTSVNQFLAFSSLQEFSLTARTDVTTKKGKPPKRTLLCLYNNIAPVRTSFSQLELTDEQGRRSAAYQELTKDFYL